MEQKVKDCPYCEENRKEGCKYCEECGKQVNEKFNAPNYNFYCEACSPNDCVEHGDIFNREIYCPKCGGKTKVLYTPLEPLVCAP